MLRAKQGGIGFHFFIVGQGTRTSQSQCRHCKHKTTELVYGSGLEFNLITTCIHTDINMVDQSLEVNTSSMVTNVSKIVDLQTSHASYYALRACKSVSFACFGLSQ